MQANVADSTLVSTHSNNDLFVQRDSKILLAALLISW